MVMAEQGFELKELQCGCGTRTTFTKREMVWVPESDAKGRTWRGKWEENARRWGWVKVRR